VIHLDDDAEPLTERPTLDMGASKSDSDSDTPRARLPVRASCQIPLTPTDLISRAGRALLPFVRPGSCATRCPFFSVHGRTLSDGICPTLPAACVDPLPFLFQVSVLAASSGPVTRWRSGSVALPSFTFRFLCLYTWLDLPCGFCFLCDTSTFVHDGFDWA